ncbi:TonB-dependent siderophore receptor [Acinetobacter sp. ESBL14]|uniref:TonB-dependent siderophore receptor n=1 Tax=Acinetobacter sp. ESBL14 TaxID=3077329 RepID=UPI002FC8505C
MVNKKLIGNRLYLKLLNVRSFYKHTLLTSFLPILCPVVYAADLSNSAENTIQKLETIVIQAKPLNESYIVNAGAFGAKDPMDIPIQIQRYDEQFIRNQSARTAYDVINKDPSVAGATYGAGFDNFRLRGFAIDNFNTIRRDGLTLAAHHDVALENVERLDVLKGPSGFLYGINSPGGTLNYILKRPTEQAFTTITAQGSSFDGRYIAMDSSDASENGDFGYRFNAAYEKNGNFRHAGDFERAFVGLATDFRLSDDVLLQLNMDWSKKSVTSDPLLRADQSTRSDPLDPATFIRPPKIDRRDLLTASWYRHQTEGVNVDAKIEIDLNDAWQSITQANYSRAERHGGYTDLFDIQPNGDIGSAGYAQSRGEVFSAYSFQSYLTGKLETGDIEHDLFFGAAYKHHGDKSPFWDIVESGDTLSVDQVSVANILHPKQPPHYDFGPKQTTEYSGKINESSIFASDLIRFSANWELLLGGRYIWYKSENLSATALAQKENTFVPAASIMFRPNDNVMTYISYSKGFERGENAPWNANNANEPTGIIESEQYEVGLKAKINDQLHIGLALFNIDRDANFLNTNNDYIKSGVYQHRGVEAEINGNLTNNLKLLSSLAYLDTELDKVDDLTTLHKRSQGTPKWKAYTGLNYVISAIDGLSIDGGVNYISNRAVDAQNSGFIPSYSVVDAGVQYQTQIDTIPVTFRVLAKNLFDKYYYVSAFNGGLAVGQPREVLFSAQLRF